MRARSVCSIAALAALAACGQDTAPAVVRNLDRPTAMAFGCYGELRLSATPEVAPARSAQPLASCAARARGEVPEGQEDVSAPGIYGFVLESARGTVAVIRSVGVPLPVVIDSDPLTPGNNPIPIGTLPVGLAPDTSGCYMVAANAGSCDLATLEVNSALDDLVPAVVTRVPVTAGGAPLLARPRAIATGAQIDTVGLECPAAASGLVYVAYPACHLVAAVDAASGEVRAGIQFAEDGAMSVTDGAVTCPVECGDGALGELAHGGIDAGLDAGAPDAGPTADGVARPVAVTLGADGKLYIGAENQERLVIATLDAAGLPVALDEVGLEGEIGVTRIAVSDEVALGGADGVVGGEAGTKRFAYLVATDATVRVVDLGAAVECDTQVDPRFLHDEADPVRLACLPVGDPATPPRRATARSPGIALPRDAVPLDVGFALVSPLEPPDDVGPFQMVGYFGFVASSDGFVFVINVDDDNYPDAESPEDPALVAIPLAMAHQIRDLVRRRDEVDENCTLAVGDPLQLGPRLNGAPTLTVDPERIALEKRERLPGLHQVTCDPVPDDLASVPVAALDFGAPVAVREQVFPDLAAATNEIWLLSWEGPLSIDSSTRAVDGPPVRRGVLDGATLADPAAPFCDSGVEPYDIAILAGCDPALGASQCGVGETCYVHPDAPSVVSSGACLPADDVDELSGRCRDFLVGLRRYSVTATRAGELVLAPRRRVLRTTPLDGCTSDVECETLAAADAELGAVEHPADFTPGPLEYAWQCQADPSRSPGADRCVMTCDGDDDCAPGTLCRDQVCVEGVVPPAECVATVQRYQLRVGEAFALIGDRSGFLHGRTLDPATGECVADPAASPLLVGRVPLRAPPCVDDALATFLPNPCATTVEQSEVVVPYTRVGDECQAGSDELRTRTAAAIRVKTPGLTLHVVDPETRGDKECIGDRAGEGAPYAAVFPGYQIQLDFTGGFVPMSVTDVESAIPVRMVTAPDGRVWVLDQADASQSTNGRLFVFDPQAAGAGFGTVIVL